MDQASRELCEVSGEDLWEMVGEKFVLMKRGLGEDAQGVWVLNDIVMGM